MKRIILIIIFAVLAGILLYNYGGFAPSYGGGGSSSSSTSRPNTPSDDPSSDPTDDTLYSIDIYTSGNATIISPNRLPDTKAGDNVEFTVQKYNDMAKIQNVIVVSESQRIIYQSFGSANVSFVMPAENVEVIIYAYYPGSNDGGSINV
ncbi:MAG: hypothetical protein MJ066_05560 [Clostridia bacterium]|nr:hypothetical protein [Clostridia bacterium]